MNRFGWIATLLVALALCALLLGGCSKEDQESVPSAKEQIDKAHAAADAANRAAARTDQIAGESEEEEEDDAEDDGEDDGEQ